MPHTGEELLRRLVHGLVNQDGFAFGTPGLSDGGSLVALPVLRTASAPRRYVLAREMPDAIRAEDPGRIDRIRARNEASRPVYVPPGSLFRGKGTASRGTTVGVLLPPRSSVEVEVKCVQPAQAIVAGASLEYSSATAPERVVFALLSRDQALVWASVARADPFGEADGGPRRDTCSNRTQCGLLVLDASGVVAAEVYESAESWRAASPAVLAQSVHPSPRVRASPLRATIEADATITLAQEFLSSLAESEFRCVTTDSWIARGSVSAYTTMDGQVLHLIAFRTERPADREPMTPTVSASIAPAPSMFPWAPGATESDGAEAAAAVAPAADVDDEAEPAPIAPRVRRRKVLTSGWDAATFQSLERYAHKEFRGDRSAAIRFLVRHGLQRRGYLGPRPPREVPLPTESAPAPVDGLPGLEMARAGLEVRIEDLERVAQAPQYAGWLRERARHELETMASSTADASLSAAARAALDRLVPLVAPAEPAEPAEAEAPPPPPPVDVRPLLRQAFTASGSGRYPEALALFDAALEVEPDNRTALLGRAVAFRRAGKAQEALADLDLVLHMEPRNAAALLNRGRLLQERGDLRGALEAFDLLVAVAANDWDVWMARGDVLVKMGRQEDALRSYGEALQRNPDDGSLRARIHALETVQAPAPPMSAPRPAMPRGVEEGQSYLVKERHREASFPVFRALAGRKIPSLLITARPRAQARQELGVASVRILGLSYALGDDVHNPTALASLTRTIERFVADNQGRGVVLLDGLDELVVNNGFRDTILFVERVNEAILQSRAIFLVSLAVDLLPDKESALLERSLKVLPGHP